MKNSDTAYDHEFSSCARTYATICIYGKKLDPSHVTKVLGVSPTRQQKTGDDLSKGKVIRNAKTSGWFLTSQDAISSCDLRAHINYLIDNITEKYQGLGSIKEIEQIMLMCFWESASGNGGPILDATIMNRLGKMEIDLHFDIWFPADQA